MKINDHTIQGYLKGAITNLRLASADLAIIVEMLQDSNDRAIMGYMYGANFNLLQGLEGMKTDLDNPVDKD